MSLRLALFHGHSLVLLSGQEENVSWSYTEAMRQPRYCLTWLEEVEEMPGRELWPDFACSPMAKEERVGRSEAGSEKF